MVLKTAEQLLDELANHVQAPPGCAVVLTERAPKAGETNWIASASILPLPACERYSGKVDDLRKSVPIVDWSSVSERNGEHRRFAKWVSEIEA